MAQSPLTPEKAHLRRGDPLGEFILLEQIGYGGEGEIWSALDHHHQRVVALKIIHNISPDPVLVTYLSSEFERQVHLIASLDHPNILPLYKFGTARLQFYFAMRYTPFGSLADLLHKGPLPLDQVLHYTAQIALALSYLHRHNIVHRDLKPSNILIGSRQQLYLADFGLAKQLSQETAPLHTGRGTFAYAPYEQHTFAQIAPQSDIYSMGLLVYEMLAGNLPWGGTTSLATQQFAHAETLPDVQTLDASLPEKLTAVLRHITAFDPQDRPPTVEQAFRLLTEAASSRKTFTQLFSPAPIMHEDLIEAQAAQQLWQQYQQAHTPAAAIKLTNLALLDFAYSKADLSGFQPDEALPPYLLSGAIHHGYHMSHWWQQVNDPQQRLQICQQAIYDPNEIIVNRAVTLLAEMQPDTAVSFPPPLLERIVDLAVSTKGAAIRNRAFEILEHHASQTNGWQTVGFSTNADHKLAELAISPRSHAERAARLIGQVGSKTAVQTIITTPSATNLPVVLERIQTAAGTLPTAIPLSLRLQLWLRWLRTQFWEDNAQLSWTRATLGLLIGLLFSLLMSFGLFARAEAQMRDGLLAPYPVSNIVTIVEVNDESLARYGRWGDWPRTLHADLIQKLNDAGAKTIVLDVIFSATTNNDETLIAAMQNAGNIVQPVSGQGDALRDTPGTIRYEAAVLPQPNLMAAGTAVGHVNILHDSDGYIRRVPTTITIDGQPYPSLSIRAIQVFLGLNGPIAPSTDDTLSILGRQIPIGPFGEMSLYYAGPPAQPGAATFTTVSYQDVLDGLVDPNLFRDKIVLVGITATAEPDRYLTAVSQGRPMYGVEILANTIEAIWSNKYIITPSLFTRIVVLMLLGLVTGLLCTRPWAGLLLAIVTVALYFLFTAWLFDWRAVMLDLLLPFLTIAFSYATITAYRYALETRRRRDMTRLFETHLSPELAQTALTAVRQGQLNLSGTTQTISVLFMRLESVAEKVQVMAPEQVMALYNGRLAQIRDIVFAHKGAIITAASQQVIAIFNAPVPLPEHEEQAATTAVALRQHLSEMETQAIEVHFAISSGKAIVGYTESALTAVGPSIQLAADLARIAQPNQVLMTTAVYEHLSANLQKKASPSITIPGDAQSEQIYSLS
ncbi:MAG: CHASE2 domain-containing protein [Ardenticatenaceae bacterium]|nr:CHASE2 domain-containing protein [Ardenticatenaceae bacterium]